MAETKQEKTVQERNDQRVNVCRSESRAPELREELGHVSSVAFRLLRDPFGFDRVKVKAQLQLAEAVEKACLAGVKKNAE